MKDLTPRTPRSAVLGLVSLPIWDEMSVRQLLMELGPPPNVTSIAGEVASGLNDVAAMFGFELLKDQEPSDNDVHQRIAKIEAHCAAALAAAGFDDVEPTREALHPPLGQAGLFYIASQRGEASGEAATMNAFYALHRLRQDAQAFAEVAKRSKGLHRRPAHRLLSLAIPKLVEALGDLYRGVWLKEPTISRNAGKLSGQFLDLMMAVANALRKRGLSFAYSKESLTKAWYALMKDAAAHGPPTPYFTVSIGGAKEVHIVEWVNQLPEGVSVAGGGPFGRFWYEDQFWWGSSSSFKLAGPIG